MVRVDDKTISLGTLISILALMGVGLAAWADVKTDIGVNSTKIESNKETDEQILRHLERVEDKLDRLIERQ